MSNKQAEPAKFFATMIEWDVSERQALDSKIRWRTAIMVGSLILNVALVAAVVPLTTLHEFQPIPIVVDKQTGTYEVRDGKERMNTEDKHEQRMIADMGIHVKAREAFTRGEAENNYRIVFNQLPEDQRAKWRHDYVEDSKSLLNTLTVRDQIKLVNPSIQWLPSNPSMPNARSAQFRFDKEEHLAGRVPTTQPFIATLTFTYDPAMVPTTIQDLMTNPFGFEVLNYRADPAGPKRELKTDNAGSIQ